jgi:hypothetical protein
MKNYLLDNYSLSKREIFQTLFVSEYGLRHWSCARKEASSRWGHRMIAVIELCPFIGLIASIIEGVVGRYIRSNHIQQTFLTSPLKEKVVRKRSMPQKKIFQGSQFQSQGTVSVRNAQNIHAQLQTCCSSGIQFNRSKIVSFLEGGACTAMSFEFLHSYYITKKDWLTYSKDNVNNLKRLLKALAPRFAQTSEDMRNRQAAFNTIEVKNQSGEMNFSKEKIESIGRLYSFAIDYSSAEIDLCSSGAESACLKTVKAC